MSYRNRIKELRWVRAADLLPHPKNWRRHPAGQREALERVLDGIGWAGVLTAREREDGSLELTDGHLRRELQPDERVPVLVTDLDPSEAEAMLLATDPIAAMAEADRELLGALMADADPELLGPLERALSELAWRPALGAELDERIAEGIELCRCQTCGHEHHRGTPRA